MRRTTILGRKAFALGLFVAFTVAACQPPAGRVFQATLLHTSLSNPSGDYPLPVTLLDQADLVVGIEPTDGDTQGGPDPFVQVDPADPKALVLTWLGGLCDNDAAVSLYPTEPGYTLRLDVHQKLGLGCPAAGVLRGLRIVTSQPIPTGSITVSGTG
jgi:hypothetical protein